jgi:large subunit ribosomal protein L22
MYSKKVGGNIAKACVYNARVSVKNTKHVCKAVRGLNLERAKKLLEDILKQRKNLDGKYYTKSTREVLNLIKSAEKNAEFNNLDLDNIYIAHISALNGTKMYRRKHKRSFGMKMKTAHLEIILKERGARKVNIKDNKKEPKEKTQELKIEKKKTETVDKSEIKSNKKEEIDSKKVKSNTKTKINTGNSKDSIDNKPKNTEN